tara:strand:- start:413 stop:1330 length:918 start_codon:yes stop_codon:yes gene_type:complete
MSKPFLRFEDGKIALGGKELMVQSADLSMSPSLVPERVYGEFDREIVGAKTEFINFKPTQGIKGKLNISFVITAEFFKQNNITNSIDRLFEIKDGMSEDPIDGNIVGRYLFDNMYLTSFGFSISPFQVIQATATYDIYGSILKTIDRRFQELSIDPAHGLKSFGEIKASNTNMDTANKKQFEVSSLSYNIMVGRKVHNHIKDGEHTSINTTPHGVVPTRVSVENVEAEMTIDSNDMVRNLNSEGNYQNGTTAEGLSDSSMDAFLYSLEGNKIAKFSCSGKILNQSMSISEGSHARGSVSIKQIIK